MNDKKVLQVFYEAVEIAKPLFKVTEEENKKFQSPVLIRTLNSNDYPERFSSPAGGRDYAPGYDSLRNLLYVPAKSPTKEEISARPWKEGLKITPPNLLDFASRYIHHTINPGMRHGVVTFFVTGKFPEGHSDLVGLVASYSGIIRGDITLQEWRGVIPFQHYFEIYLKKGDSFLEKLSRMSLDEAREEGIVPFKKINL